MKKSFLKRLGICALSAAFCAAAFASCKKEGKNPADISTEQGGVQEVELTKEEFLAELEKRESVSSAGKKRGKVNVAGTIYVNGDVEDVDLKDAEIVNGGYVGIYGKSGRGTLVRVFGVSAMCKENIDGLTECKEYGENLKCVVSVITEDGVRITTKMTIDAGGYLTEYEVAEGYNRDVCPKKILFSGYTHESSAAEKPGEETPQEEKEVAADRETFLKEIKELQAKKAYAEVTVTRKGVSQTLKIENGYVKYRETYNGISTTESLIIGADEMEKRLNRVDNEKKRADITKKGDKYIVRLIDELKPTYYFNEEGYVEKYTEEVSGKIVRSLKFENYKQ